MGVQQKAMLDAQLCGSSACEQYSHQLWKMVYGNQHHKWLHIMHSLRQPCVAFNHIPKWGTTPPRITRSHVQIWRLKRGLSNGWD